MTKIKVYTITDCPYCTELKDYLIKDNIEFIEVNIELPENEPEFIEVSKLAKSEVVPLIKIDKRLLVPNVSFHTIYDGFMLTKKLLNEE